MNSDYIVYVDESGDHSMTSIDPHYPMFVLALCVFRKVDYAQSVMPAVTNLKFKYFGHDQVILHEREIRKAQPPFSFLVKQAQRTAFMNDIDQLVANAPFTLIAGGIDKVQHRAQYSTPANPYELALTFGLERLAMHLNGKGAKGTTYLVFESRGEREDDDLELWFHRICGGQNMLGTALPFALVFAKKATNSSGLQFADMMARPIGRHIMSPKQSNRAFKTLSAKFRVNPRTGSPAGYGLKVFP
jgi:hypothetical protein